MSKKQNVTAQRRDFLKGVAAAGGAAALALASNRAIASTPEKPSDADDSAEAKGYRKTAHVKAFYASARL